MSVRRLASRLAAASGSAGSASAAVRRLACCAARPTRASAHSPAKSAGADTSSTAPPASTHRSSSARACLQGNLRLGHEHRNAGPVRSTLTWYGVDPDPWHLPHTSVSVAPVSDHGPGVASLRAAATDAASGARSLTCELDHRIPMEHRSWQVPSRSGNRPPPRGGRADAGARTVAWRTLTVMAWSARSEARLVGRGAETDALRGALEQVVAGRGGVVILSGEAGIGKTSLLGHLVGDADRL